MNNKQVNIILWLIISILLLLGIIIINKARTSTSNDLLTYLSSSATFAIALLTVMYVLTTRKQLEVMSMQLNEMRKDRELLNQPLPWPIKLIGTSRKPRFFYAPPNSYEACSQNYIRFKLKNIGSTPAVSIDVCCYVIIPDKERKIKLSSRSIRIDVLEYNQEFPSNEGEKDNFLFYDDLKTNLLIHMLTSNLKELPLVELHIYFKNILGACFHIEKLYRLYPNPGDRDIIKTWIEILNNFPIRYKESIELLKTYTRSGDSRGEEIFKELEQKANNGLNIDEIEYSVWPIPASGTVSSISISEYEQITRDLSYAVKITDGLRCIAEKKI